MVCIYCSSPTQVVNSRLQRRNNHIWRRRTCAQCASTFTTTERPELETSFMVTTSGKLEPFYRDQLFLSLYRSCKHRPSALSDATALTQIIIADVLASQTEGAIKRELVIEIAERALKRLDPIAATVYRAYHAGATNAS